MSPLRAIMPDSDESDLKKYIHKLEARIEALEKSAEERMHSFSEKWFKRSPSRELRNPRMKVMVTVNCEWC